MCPGNAGACGSEHRSNRRFLDARYIHQQGVFAHVWPDFTDYPLRYIDRNAYNHDVGFGGQTLDHANILTFPIRPDDTTPNGLGDNTFNTPPVIEAADTLPGFMAAQERPVRLAHIDCDLYSSTVDVLRHLSPAIRPGSILVFDEYFGYPGWREHEHRAFVEAAAAHGWRYRYLALNPFGKNAALRIEGRIEAPEA